MAYAGMSQEQIFLALQQDNAQMKADMVAMKHLLDQQAAAAASRVGGEDEGAAGGGKGFGKGFGRDGFERRALLNRKDFSLVDKVEGNMLRLHGAMHLEC